MESKTKNKQDMASIHNLIRHAFRETAVPTDEGRIRELSEGWFNAAYHIVLRDGREVILKIAPPAHAEIMTYEANLMAAEVQALRMVKAHTNVPVPDVCFYDDSKTLLDVPYFFMEKIDGTSYASVKHEMKEEEKERVEAQIGQYNRELNQLQGGSFGLLTESDGTELHTGHHKKTWSVYFTELMEDVLADGESKSIDLGVPYSRIRELLRSAKPLLDEVVEPRLVHWDLWDGNVMVKDGQITGIIDFERAFWGDPLIEHYFRCILEEQQPAAFLKGYGKRMSDFSENELRRRALYNLYLYLIMTIECFYRAYEGDEQYDWARDKLHETLRYLGADS